jgi:deoxyadenosine/deoxycytidine kinase
LYSVSNTFSFDQDNKFLSHFYGHYREYMIYLEILVLQHIYKQIGK